VVVTFSTVWYISVHCRRHLFLWTLSLNRSTCSCLKSVIMELSIEKWPRWMAYLPSLLTWRIQQVEAESIDRSHISKEKNEWLDASVDTRVERKQEKDSWECSMEGKGNLNSQPVKDSLVLEYCSREIAFLWSQAVVLTSGRNGLCLWKWECRFWPKWSEDRSHTRQRESS